MRGGADRPGRAAEAGRADPLPPSTHAAEHGREALARWLGLGLELGLGLGLGLARNPNLTTAALAWNPNLRA